MRDFVKNFQSIFIVVVLWSHFLRVFILHFIRLHFYWLHHLDARKNTDFFNFISNEEELWDDKNLEY